MSSQTSNLTQRHLWGALLFLSYVHPTCIVCSVTLILVFGITNLVACTCGSVLAIYFLYINWHPSFHIFSTIEGFCASSRVMKLTSPDYYKHCRGFTCNVWNVEMPWPTIIRSLSGLPQVREKILQGQGKDREFYFQSDKIEII